MLNDWTKIQPCYRLSSIVKGFLLGLLSIPDSDLGHTLFHLDPEFPQSWCSYCLSCQFLLPVKQYILKWIFGAWVSLKQMWWANTWRRHYLTWYTTFTPGSVSVMRFMASIRGRPYSVDTRERSWLPSYRCNIVIFLSMIRNQKTCLAVLTTQLASLSFGVLSSHLCIWFNTVWADNGLKWAGRIPISLKLNGKSEHW